MSSPHRANPSPRLRKAALTAACLLVLAAAAGLVLALMVELAPVTLAVVVALLMAALIEPVPRRLRRVGLPPWLAALIGVVTLLVVVALPFFVIISQLVDQWPELSSGLSQSVDRLAELLPVSDERMESIFKSLRTSVLEAAPDPVGGASVVTQVMTATLLSVVLLFFLLKDGTTMWQWVLRAASTGVRSRVDMAGRASWRTTVSYIRGELVIAGVDAVGIGLALLLVGVPLALPLAALTFITAFVPIAGALVSGAVAVLIALVSNGLTDALLVLGAVLLVQQAEGNLLQPVIMGQAVRLHGAVILVAVTAGTMLAGIAGAVLAVPVLAAAYRVWQVLAEDRNAEEEPAGDE
ncbi:AI-2E family transporter [Streptomyces cyaneofuscatus]|uniref:AI-2E family transporter n=1 Tax=Streptomyces cyaneofuscatus TaxID=66883 RepID=UPI003650E1FB